VRNLPRFPHRRLWSHKFLAWAREHWTLERLNGWRRAVMAEYTERSEAPLLERLNRMKPSVIYSTHPLSTQVIISLRKKGRLEWDPHLCSVTTEMVFAPQDSPYITTHFAATEQSAAQMTELRGVPADRIVVSGLPIHAPAYSLADKAETRRRLGFSETAPTVYVAGGGFGRGHLATWVNELKKVEGLQILVVCGGNRAVLADLTRTHAGSSRVRVFGLLDDPTPFMAISNLYVGLEGGSTAAQMVTYGAVSIFPFPTEHANAMFLQSHAGAMILQTPAELPGAVNEIVGSLEYRRARVLRIARPEAADAVAATIEALSGERRRAVGAG